jgi:hypothetical protein
MGKGVQIRIFGHESISFIDRIVTVEKKDSRVKVVFIVNKDKPLLLRSDYENEKDWFLVYLFYCNSAEVTLNSDSVPAENRSGHHEQDRRCGVPG